MTQDEINAMAKEAGLMYMPQPNSPLVRIVRKAVAKEREACALVCDERSQDVKLSNLRRCDADLLARAIRARSQA